MKKISKRDYIVSAGIVPVRIVDGEPLFLMLRAWTFWDFPKGRKEEGESDLETALRETMEEASIPSEAIEFPWGKECFETEPYRKRKDKVGRYFVGKTDFTDIDMPVNPELGKPEHQEYRWVSYDEAQSMTNDRIGSVLKWAYNKIKS